MKLIDLGSKNTYGPGSSRLDDWCKNVISSNKHGGAL